MKLKEKPLGVADDVRQQGVKDKTCDSNNQGILSAISGQPEGLADNSAPAQRQRLLTHLKSGKSITTLQARHLLDVMHPAARLMELRQAGYQIESIWVNDITPEGHIHRVARYLLNPNKQRSIFDLICLKKENPGKGCSLAQGNNKYYGDNNDNQ